MIEKTEQEFYNIGALAKLAGISVRTLHYYDQIGLLNPSFRDENDYRLYDFNDLLRLQQILFFRELEVPLKKIKEILDDSREDWIEMLEQHYHHLEKKIDRLEKLQGTIEKTIHNLEEKAKMPLTDAELYEGFSKEKFKRYQREARNAYGHEKVEATNNRLRSMSKAEWNAVKEEGANIAVELGALINRDSADPDVQALIARQHTWIENFYPAPAEVFRSLGDLYANHPEFRANYEQFAPGLADFLQEAMYIYADTILSNNL
jgi:DNA-binding transcriptional MerR regulator